MKINPFKDFEVKHTPVDFIILTDPAGLYNAQNYNILMSKMQINTGQETDPQVSESLMTKKLDPDYDPLPIHHSQSKCNSLYLKTLGAYKIAHECRLRGYTVQVVDYQSFYDLETLKRIADKYVGENTLAIGISNSFYMRYPWMLNMLPNEMPVLPLEGIKDLNKMFGDPLYAYSGFLMHGEEIDDAFTSYVKSINPNVKFVKGGSRAREDITMRNVDYVNVGWGDVTMPDMLDEIKSNTADNMPVHTTHPYKIDLLSKIEMKHSTMKYTDSDILIPGEIVPLESARGCIFKCSFCHFELTGKEKGTYYKSAESIREEFLENYEKHGISDYWFVEDTFNDDHEKMVYLHEIITSLPFKITFSCYLRLDMLYVNRNHDIPQHQLLLEMGLKRAEFGVETTNPESAKDIGKGLNPAIQLSFLRDLKDNHGWDSIVTGSGFILGLPSDTIESIQETFKILSSEEFPIDRPTLRVLHIAPEEMASKDISARGTSEFSRNWKKHGYTMTGEFHNGVFNTWTNRNGVSLDMCERMVINYFRRKGMRPFKDNGMTSILDTIGIVELVAQGLHWPTVSEDIKWASKEFHQANLEDTKKLAEIQAMKFMKYTEILLTQDI